MGSIVQGSSPSKNCDVRGSRCSRLLLPSRVPADVWPRCGNGQGLGGGQQRDSEARWRSSS
eukprot:284736-Pyramimonas_sp.AAC.1